MWDRDTVVATIMAIIILAAIICGVLIGLKQSESKCIERKWVVGRDEWTCIKTDAYVCDFQVYENGQWKCK